jgi:hypothetical protein
MKFETVCASLMLCCLCVQPAFAADAPAVPSQDTTFQEVANVANKFIKTTREPDLATPNTVATMIPYTPKVAAGHGVAKYAVLCASRRWLTDPRFKALQSNRRSNVTTGGAPRSGPNLVVSENSTAPKRYRSYPARRTPACTPSPWSFRRELFAPYGLSGPANPDGIRTR